MFATLFCLINGVNHPNIITINLEWEIVGYSSVEVRLINVFAVKYFIVYGDQSITASKIKFIY